MISFKNLSRIWNQGCVNIHCWPNCAKVQPVGERSFPIREQLRAANVSQVIDRKTLTATLRKPESQGAKLSLEMEGHGKTREVTNTSPTTMTWPWVKSSSSWEESLLLQVLQSNKRKHIYKSTEVLRRIQQMSHSDWWKPNPPHQPG